VELRNNSIIKHNLRVFYVVDIFRAMWFITSIWVIYERQFLTLTQLTFIEALILAASLVTQLFTGAFADLFGRRTAMVIGMLLYAVSLSLYSVSTVFSQFILYALFFGLAESFIDGTREALLYDTMKQEGETVNFPVISSKLSMIFQVTLAIATVIGGWIGSFSYIYVIRMTAASFLLAAISSLFFREPAIDSEKFSMKGYISKTKKGVLELFRNSYIKKISLYYVLIGSITWVCVITFNIMLLSELRYTTTQIGFAIAATRIVNSVILFRLIRVGTFFTKRRTFLLLPFILVVSFLPGIWLSKWLALIPVMGAMLVSTARWNLLTRYTNAEFESKNRATAISALAMVIGIIFVIVVGISGYVMEHFGGARTVYSILGIITLFTALPLGIHLAKNHSE
jgi:MFS family permease